jgi:3-mercaptopyruvate sulfurtransferase SseA
MPGHLANLARVAAIQHVLTRLGHLDDSNVVVAEVDELPELYDEGHVPGANKLHWRDD